VETSTPSLGAQKPEPSLCAEIGIWRHTILSQSLTPPQHTQSPRETGIGEMGGHGTPARRTVCCLAFAGTLRVVPCGPIPRKPTISSAAAGEGGMDSDGVRADETSMNLWGSRHAIKRVGLVLAITDQPPIFLAWLASQQLKETLTV